MADREAALAALRKAVPGAIQESDGRAVVLPRNEHELAEALRAAGVAGIQLAPPGAPTHGAPAVASIGLQRMGAVLGFDDASRILHVQAGCPIATIERELGRRGLGLGLRGEVPDCDVGTWLAIGAPGGRDPHDDPVDHLVAGLGLLLPDARLVRLRPAPRRAVGPDLIAAALGARGRLGVIVSAHLVARPRARTEVHAYQLGSREAATHALAWMRGVGVRAHAAEVTDAGILRIELAAGGALAGATLAAVQRMIEARGGALATTAPPSPAPMRGQPIGPTIEMLARALDPRGVLGGTA